MRPDAQQPPRLLAEAEPLPAEMSDAAAERAVNLDGAVCDGVATADYDPFFPDTHEAEADALAMCRICPAREACLAYAIETRQMFGIWGGRTQREIRYLIAHAARLPAGVRHSRP